MKLKWCIKQKWQKLTRGYSDEELWNLDSTICKWLLPRLKTFKEKTKGYPPDLKSPKEWDEILEKIILALELHNSYLPDSPEQAILETGHYRSRLCKEYNNLFGLYNSSKQEYFKFSHWTESVEAYKNKIQSRYKDNEDYYNFLERINYAENNNYIKLLKSL